ncbi:MAG: DnaB-like helicase C-terminal domain-containing protein [Bacteroidales bacterium]|nr:DnaB-like helicase C-terminal domain-containing protein [Bacteroidales bacterium]
MEQDLEATERKQVLAFSSSKDIVNQALKNTIYNTNSFPNNAVSSGFHKLDQKTSGFKNAELTAIAVRPGMGKTSFLLSLINNIAIKQRRSVAVFSYERSAGKIIQRLIETETGVSLNKIRDGKLKDSEKDHAQTMVDNISNADININDEPNPTVENVVQYSRELTAQQKPEIIFIDYLEMLAANIQEPETRKEECAHILDELRNMAKELNIPVVVFSQISRTNSPHRPSINDIGEILKEKAHNLLFLHRNDNTEAINLDLPMGHTELIIARDSYCEKPGKINIKFIDSIDKFVNMEVD